MVAAYCDPGSANCQLVVRPNCSLSWRGTVTFYLGMCLVSLTIAGLFAAAGAWLVLPFAGIELLALGGALYVVALRADSREVIAIRGDTVEVQRGRYAPAERWSFQRCWVQVILRVPRRSGYPCRLVLRGNGHELEVGRCLDDAERRLLANELRRRIRPAYAP